MSSGLWQPSPLSGLSVAPFNLPGSKKGVNGPTERRILKVFLPEFRIQSELLTDLEILQLQWITDSSSFFLGGGGWGGILDFACHKIFLPGFPFENKISTEDLGDKS